MSVSCGFFNSKLGDRKYDATQISTVFDGVINDGIFASVGDQFAVTAGEGMNVVVGKGRCWYQHSWTVNDSPIILPVTPGVPLLSRIDLVVIDNNNDNDFRINDIKIIEGVPASDPAVPTAIFDDNRKQVIIGELRVGPSATTITASNITSKIGQGHALYVTGPLETFSIDTQVAQWTSEWSDWKNEKTLEYATWWANYQASLNAAATENQNNFETWFQTMKDQLTTDAAGNLQNQINIVNNQITVLNDFKVSSANTLDKLTRRVKITLPTSSWSANTNSEGMYSCIYYIPGMYSDAYPIISLAINDIDTSEIIESKKENFGKILNVLTKSGELMFLAVEKPTIGLEIYVDKW